MALRPESLTEESVPISSKPKLSKSESQPFLKPEASLKFEKDSSSAAISKLASIRRLVSKFSLYKHITHYTTLPWGPEMRMLIAGEFLFQYVRESAAEILKTGYADELGVFRLESFYQIQLQLCIGTVCGLFIGYVSDAISSQFTIMVISLVFFSFVPVLCCIASIPTVETEVRKPILKILRYTFAVFTLAGGTRLAFLFSQDFSLERSLLSSKFIFWCIWTRYFAEFIHGLVILVPYESMTLLINGFIISISSMIYVAAFFMMKPRMVATIPYFSLVNDTLFPCLPCAKNPEKHDSHENTKESSPRSEKLSSLPYQSVKTLPSLEQRSHHEHSDFMSNSVKQFGNFLLLILPFFGYGTSHFLLFKVYMQQFQYLYAGKYYYFKQHYVPMAAFFTLIFLLVLRWIVFPVSFRSKNKYVKMTSLKSIIISYIFMAGAVIYAYVIQTKIENLNTLPTLNKAQVLIFNGLSHKIIIHSKTFQTNLEPREKYKIEIETKVGSSQDINISYTGKTMQETIEFEPAQSISYILNESGMRKLERYDPIFEAPPGFNKPNYPVTFLISIDESINGDLHIYYPSKQEYNVIAIEYIEDRKYFTIESGTFVFQFQADNEVSKFEDVDIRVGGVYAFLIYMNPLSIVMYNLKEPIDMAPYILIPGMVMNSISNAFAFIPLYEFTYSIVPAHTISISMSYSLLAQTVGIAIALWTQTKDSWHLLSSSNEILIHFYVLFASFVIFFFLAIFLFKSKLL